MDLFEDYLNLEEYYIAGVNFSALSVALELSIFEEIAKGSSDISLLAKSFSLDLQVFNALIESLISLKFLIQDNNKIQLTEKSKIFLLKESPYYRADTFLLKTKSAMHERIKSALLKGKASLEYEGKSLTDMWNKGEVNSQTAEAFTTQMHRLMSFPAHQHCLQSSIKELSEVLDIGGGSGAWAIELSKINPSMKITIFDLPEVLAVAQKIINIQDLSLPNIHYQAGSFFEALPESANYLMSNILHDWPLDKCEIILSKIFQGLKKGGILYINECLLNEDRTSPVFTSLFNLLMAVNHNSQQFTFESLKEVLNKNGLGNLQIVSQVGHYHLLRCQKLA